MTGKGQHQAARAIDCVLASYATKTDIVTQCPIQDFSAQAVITNAKLAANDGEKAMNFLFTKQGMKSLVSEWWHFEEQVVSETARIYTDNKAQTKIYSFSGVNDHDASVPNMGIL